VGQHRVIVTGNDASMEQTVQIDAGATASLVVPFSGATSAAVAPGTGWITVAAPFEMQVFEEGRLLGTSDRRIGLSPGQHTIEVASTALNFRTSRRVSIQSGRNTALAIEVPKGTLNVNATPWAEVWIDGKQVGETPIGNLSIAAGPHEVVFKHPELGEKQHAVVVSASGITRLSIDLRK
jgi:hypothetical protein